ncbi:MAG: hypothetical protein JWR51_4704 [Devosia sp.]|uniref:phage tail tip lysozyme n=1 Tax=Devosia sp. TaxID=1871048 RepID=UPI002626599C|nr:phage tail tip lysozyme [Devosia sp.]MDB5531601.1 hypothetical protein [Devosia sp.]
MASNPAKTYIDGFVARGFSPVQAAVLAGNFAQESGFNTDAYNPKEDAYGGIQWRLDRKTGLEQYAKDTGRKVNDPDLQMDYVVKEMTGNEAANAAEFLAAQDPLTANKSLKKFIRYGDNSENARLNNALSYMGQPSTGGGNALMASNAPAGGGNPLFVNPSFGGAEMPAPAAWPSASPVAAPATDAPANDDALLNQFAAPTAQPGGQSDDDLLNSFMPGAAAPATTGGDAADEDLLRSFLPATPGEGDIATPPAGLVPGSKEYADWAVEQARAGKRLPQVSEIPEDQAGAPTGLLDKAHAAAASYMDAMPVVGPAWLDLAEKARASVQGMPLDTVKEETAAAREANPMTSNAAGVAGTVLPMLAAGATTAGGNLLGVTGPIAQRVLMGGASNALISGADTLARGGDLEQAGKNALIGGALGVALPAVGDAVGQLGNQFLGKTTPAVAQLAEAAVNKYGIPIGPGQITESPMVKFADSVVNKMPFSGGTVSNGQQAAAFNKAVANTFGETAEKITPDVMARARDRIGTAFEDAAAKTPAIAADTAFDQAMLDAVTNAQMNLTEQQMGPILKQFDNIVGKFQQGSGSITGRAYQELTKKGAPLDVALHSADPGIRAFARQAREALDDAFERSAAPDVLDGLKNARSQWKAMKTVEDLVEKSPAGDINPALLMGAVRSSYDNMAYGAGGDLAELARIGQQFLKSPPSSGTAERLAVMNMLTKVGGAGGLAATAAMNPGSIPMMAAVGLPAAGAYLLAAKGGGALLRSAALGNKLIGNSLGRAANPATMTGGNLLLRSVAGATAPRAPVEITVNGGNPLLSQ